MRTSFLLIFIFSASLLHGGNLSSIKDFDVNLLQPVTGKFFIELLVKTDDGNIDRAINDTFNFYIDDKYVALDFFEGKSLHKIAIEKSLLLFISHKNKLKSHKKLYHFYVSDGEINKTYIPLWLSIVPPLMAIILALIFKEVVISIFIGIFAGAFIANGFRIELLLTSFFNVIDKYILTALTDKGHLSIIIFSIMIAGMVAIISRNGGMSGIIIKLSKYANSARNTQIIAWLLGIAIFFDDYANTLIVGNTMRPVTDKFKVSREKLAYIVDSTAAPIAAIAFISTWIGAELGYIQDAVDSLDIQKNAYTLFFNSLSYSYYPVLSIIFMFFLIRSGKDFGPMLKAEKRAMLTGKTYGKTNEKESEGSLKSLEPIEGIRHKWYNGLMPILTVLVVTILGLISSGYDNTIWNNNDLGFFKKIAETIGRSDSYTGLLWGALAGASLAILLTISQKIMTIGKTMITLTEGFKNMLPAIIILVMAWSLALTTNELHTADFFTTIFSNVVNPLLLPVIIFLLAAVISFSTGTSWGTMAILYPLMLPTAWAICMETGMSGQESLDIFCAVISVILAGSVFGDHCSPISDTTILSSLASHCNHIDHVRTQLPYALVVAAISILLLILPLFLAVHWGILFMLGIIAAYLVVKLFGKKIRN